jgi:hypothetical protein
MAASRPIPQFLRRLRAWELLPEALLVLGLGAFFVTERQAALSAFRSSKAIALMVIVAVAWVGARLVLARFDRLRIVRTVLFGIAALGVLAVVVFPAYRNERVVEARPATAAATPVRTAALMGIDHRAAGTVSLYRTSDGRHLVGLEQIDIQPGPDYDVYLVPGADRRSRTGGIRLDDLRGNQGTQFYEVPSGTALGDGGWTVLVWCAVFDVPIANATPV